MKSKLTIIPLIILVIIACCGVETAFVSAQRWFERSDLRDNSADIGSWIKVTVTSAEGFYSNEEYIAEFVVKQWGESGSYKLVLGEVGFFCPSKEESLDPDGMWEYDADGIWTPISEAKNFELIPAVTGGTHTVCLKIRMTPHFFQEENFAEYLDYHLELTAELVRVNAKSTNH